MLIDSSIYHWNLSHFVHVSVDNHENRIFKVLYPKSLKYIKSRKLLSSDVSVFPSNNPRFPKISRNIVER